MWKVSKILLPLEQMVEQIGSIHRDTPPECARLHDDLLRGYPLRSTKKKAAQFPAPPSS